MYLRKWEHLKCTPHLLRVDQLTTALNYKYRWSSWRLLVSTQSLKEKHCSLQCRNKCPSKIKWSSQTLFYWFLFWRVCDSFLECSWWNPWVFPQGAWKWTRKIKKYYYVLYPWKDIRIKWEKNKLLKCRISPIFLGKSSAARRLNVPVRRRSSDF